MPRSRAIALAAATNSPFSRKLIGTSCTQCRNFASRIELKNSANAIQILDITACYWVLRHRSQLFALARELDEDKNNCGASSASFGKLTKEPTVLSIGMHETDRGLFRVTSSRSVIVAALILSASGLLAAFMLTPRYSISNPAKGLTVRLDKKSGDMIGCRDLACKPMVIEDKIASRDNWVEFKDAPVSR